MKVNGEQIQLTKATTLEEFLKEQGYNIQRIAIERNDEIVPRENFSDVMLNNSDIIEVVHFMGGGC
ncbi:sulfur carrier protein ThiS [Clostridium sp. AM09-51]|uniref:sulfur carrier protein ThiS n=1 Tax=Pseudoruminococcus massiliensis TaxID=2086583 RepID=UPI000E50D846|nr:sulfur carrier protein ThiS [Pseudoruminococcus massiliensis]RHO50658.1 sulfur carrier protein ThiS [Clostridium sp. AM09-51]